MSKPFVPSYGSNTTMTLVAATPQTRPINGNDSTIRVFNTGANPAYIISYNSINGAQVASATKGTYIPIGMMFMFTKANSADTLSAFSTLGTSLEVMTGVEGF